MNLLLIYMVKTAIYLAGFYIVFFIFLSRDTQYDRNRIYLILSVISAFILPAVNIHVREQSSIFYFGKTLSEVFVTDDGAGNQVTTLHGNGLNIANTLLGVYLAGVLIFSLKLLIDILSLLVLISRHKKDGEHVVYFNGLRTSGFSALGMIFINQALEKTEADEVIRHEQNHIDHRHFLDILLIEITLALQWFNPIVYLINKSLRAIHEYQADRGYLKSGIEITLYQKLLLGHVFKTGRINIYNSFSNPSLLKKRMIMMSRKPSSGTSDLKILMIIPVVILFLSAISSCEENISLSRSDGITIMEGSQSGQPMEISKAPVYRVPVISEKYLPPPPPPPPPPVDNSIRKINGRGVVIDEPSKTNLNDTPNEVFVVVEKMPTFPGGDKEMMKYIYSKISYPESAKAANIQGKVTLRFAVLATGKIGNISVIKRVDPSLDNEAIRVIQSLPDWEPGMQGGKAVNVWYTVPVTFQLK